MLPPIIGQVGVVRSGDVYLHAAMGAIAEHLLPGISLRDLEDEVLRMLSPFPRPALTVQKRFGLFARVGYFECGVHGE